MRARTGLWELRAGNCPKPPSRASDQAGGVLNVSGKSVDRANAVIKKGTPELIAAVDSGEVAVSVGAKLAELPEAEQKKAVKSGRSGIKEAIEKAKTKPAFPLSDGFMKIMEDVVAALNLVRADHGTMVEMIRSPKWDNNEDHNLLGLVSSLQNTFTKIESEMKDLKDGS